MTQEDVAPNGIDPDLAMAALRPLQGFTFPAHLLDGDSRRAAGGLIGLRPLLRLEVELGEANEACCGERSLGAIGLLPCRVRSQHQLLGLAVAAEALVDLDELAEGAKGMHRVCAVLLLLQTEGTFVERLGLGIAPLRAVEFRQLLDRAGGLLALDPLLLLRDRQRAFQQRLGFAIAALGDIELSQLVQAESREPVLRVACARTSFLRLLVVQVRFGAAPLLAVDVRRCFVCQSRLQLQLGELIGFLADRQRPFQEQLGLGEAALFDIELRQRVETVHDARMLGTVPFLRRRYRALVELLGLGVLALSRVSCRLVAELNVVGSILVGTMGRLSSALLQQLGLCGTPKSSVDRSQHAQDRHCIGVGRTERLLPDCQRALQERLGLGEATLDAVKASQRHEAPCGVEVVFPFLRPHQLGEPLCQGNGLAPFALDHQLGNARLEGLDLIALRERVVCYSCGNQEKADQQADETAGTHSAASHT